MNWLLIELSMLTLTLPAMAVENEAEKLFRAMEQKVKAAKTLRVKFELDITDAAGKKGLINATLLLGEGDRFRIDGEGKIFGQAVKFVTVSNGTTQVEMIEPEPPCEKPKRPPSPKGAGEYLRATLPSDEFFLCSPNMDRRAKREPGALTGFKLAGNEKIAGGTRG